MKKFFTLDDAVVTVHRPRVLLETAMAQGAGREELLIGTGMTPAMLEIPETRVSHRQVGTLALNALRLTGNPALGFDVGANTRFAQIGVLGLALMSSATAGEALAVLMRHARSLAPALDFDLQVDGDCACLSLRETIALGPLRPFATEWWLAAYAAITESLIARPLPLRELRFAYAEPAYAASYARFNVPLRFSQAQSALFVDAAVLDAKIAYADPVTARIAERSYVMTTPTPPPPGGLLAQVRRLLDAGRGRPLRLGELARELQTSSRTLNRELQGMGTTYRQLLDDSRRERALEWVRGSDMTTVQIASELGFSDVRGFRRAFKRWTGDLPTRMRAQHTRV